MEFIQIIVIVGIIGFYFFRNVRKELAKEQQRDPSRQPGTPMQPDDELPDDEAEREETAAQPAPAIVQTPPPPPPRRPARPAMNTARPAPLPEQTPAPTRESISLRTAEEARRAFIYSEIFNRKY